MANYRKYSKKNKKNYRRRYRRKVRRPLPLNGFSDQMIARHRYVDQFSITCSGVTQTSNSVAYSANGMYDPEVLTGMGQFQPKGFDEMMNIYQHYRVLGAKATIHCVASDQRENMGILFGVKLSDQPSTLVARSFEDLYETRGLIKRLLQVNNPGSSFTRSQKAVCKYSAKKTHGKGFEITNRNQGTSASNPTEGSFFEVVLCPLAGNTTTVQTVPFIITIDYIVKYSERKALERSQ